MEEKMVSTSQNVSCPLASISSFFKNCFLLITIMVSTSRRLALTKKILFPLGKKPVCTNRMKNIEKYATIIRESCFYFKKSLKKLQKSVSTSRNIARL